MLGFLGAIASAALVIVWLISIITIIKDARSVPDNNWEHDGEGE